MRKLPYAGSRVQVKVPFAQADVPALFDRFLGIGGTFLRRLFPGAEPVANDRQVLPGLVHVGNLVVRGLLSVIFHFFFFVGRAAQKGRDFGLIRHPRCGAAMDESDIHRALQIETRQGHAESEHPMVHFRHDDHE